MKRTNNVANKPGTKPDYRKPNRKPNRGGCNKPNSSNRDDRTEDREEDGTMLNPKGRNNNPNWYFLDARVADQVSQLSFQQLADTRFPVLSASCNGSTVTLINNQIQTLPIVSVLMNPSPGVQLKAALGVQADLQKSAINLAGFRLFSKLSAFTGRKQEYGPQDISTLILYMGEIISCTEWIRRAFGVCYTMNMRNRAFPIRILEAMRIDATDLFTNYASYRTRFNALITRINQVPIPQNIAYFDKCASLYEKVYLDSESPMAQIIVHSPHTTWRLRENLSSQGTVLRTTSWCGSVSGSTLTNIQTMDYYLDLLEGMVDDLLNSATYNIVYMDLLNLNSKINMPFWKMDYLLDGYVVYPEYNSNALLMLHNATIAHTPSFPDNLTEATGITPFNDVWPDIAGNALYYNPAIPWTKYGSTQYAYPSIPHGATIIDSATPDPTVEDRIEMVKFTSMGGASLNSNNVRYSYDCVLSDHYITDLVTFVAGSSTPTNHQSTFVDGFDLATIFTQLDWAPIFRHLVINGSDIYPDGELIGDLNYYTEVSKDYLRKIVDFSGFALYDLRDK